MRESGAAAAALAAVERVYPYLRINRYDPTAFEVDSLIGEADLVIVHE